MSWLAVWLIAALIVALAFGRVVDQRERQVPRPADLEARFAAVRAREVAHFAARVARQDAKREHARSWLTQTEEWVETPGHRRAAERQLRAILRAR